MKKSFVCLVLAVVLLLCGCAAATTEPPNEAKDEETDVKETYYEALIEDLRRELLSLRADFYVKEETYQARIAELEKQLSASAEKPSPGGRLFKMPILLRAWAFVRFA